MREATGARRRNEVLRRAALGMLACILLVAACREKEPEVSIVTAERDIVIDVRNTLFNAPDPASPSTQGLGVTSLTLSIVTDPAGDWTATLGSAGLDATGAANGYTRVTIADVSGELVSVGATASSEAGDFSVTLGDYPGEDVYKGWTHFRNVLKFRLTYGVAATVADSELSLSVAPKGGGAVSVKADCGVAGTDCNTGLTDRSADLVSRQVAVKVGLDENRNDVTFDVYTKVIDEDISAVYNPDVNYSATYLSDPWTPAWTYDQIAGGESAGGRSVGGTVYQLGDALLTGIDAASPPSAAEGQFSILVDLRYETDPDLLDKFVLIGIIVKAEGLFVPVDVLCLPIE